MPNPLTHWRLYADAKRRGDDEEAQRILDQHHADDRVYFVKFLREGGYGSAAGRILGNLRALLDELASALRARRCSTHEPRDCQRRASLRPRELTKIPQGTHNGQKFRLREKGVHNSRTGKRGDQIVDVQVLAPVVQDERTKELLREYAQLHPEDPRATIWAQGMNP